MCENIDIKNREVLILHGFYAVRTGLEPVTSCVTGRHSNQAELTHPISIPYLRLQRYKYFFLIAKKCSDFL